jgi:diguanylate cyclase
MYPRFLVRLWLAVLGPSGHRRLRVSQSLLAAATYLAFAAVQHIEVMLGLVDAQESAWLTAFYLLGALAFYVVIRSGLSERLGDPALSLPQMGFGVLTVVGSYAITGPARGAVMTLLVLVLVYGMFALRGPQARGLAVCACALLSLAMWWKTSTDPVRYPPAVEAVHFVFALIVLSVVAMLVTRMSLLRSRLREQKASLEKALMQIRLLATQDELTGLSNRRHMNELMVIEKSRQARSGQAMSVVMIDIDLFKRINDTYGHHGGDLVLKTFAQVIRRGLRAVDVLGRWGGEEFLLLLPDTPLSEAELCVERMRTNLARLGADAIAPGLRVTFSAGISLCPPDTPLEAAIDRADQAMYRAKTQGRNCTVLDVVQGTVPEVAEPNAA